MIHFKNETDLQDEKLIDLLRLHNKQGFEISEWEEDRFAICFFGCWFVIIPEWDSYQCYCNED